MRYKKVESQIIRGLEIIFAIKPGGRMSSLFAVIPAWVKNEEPMTISRRAVAAILQKSPPGYPIAVFYKEFDKFSPGFREFLEANNIREDDELKNYLAAIDETMVRLTHS